MSEQLQPLVWFGLTIYKESSDRDLEYLRKTIISMSEQKYNNYEIFIIADKETPESLIAYCKHFVFCNIYYCNPISKERKPFANTDCIQQFINFAIESKLPPKYIAITHSDNFSTSDRLEIQVKSLEQHPDAAISFAGWIFPLPM